MDVSVIIVNYNTVKMTKECIDSIFQYTDNVEFEIIVVDNNSSDGSISTLRELYSNVKIIESKENIGFGRANNVGAKHACGKYLFLLNSDTLLKDNALKSFFDFFEIQKENIEIGVVGGILENVEGVQCESFDRFPSLVNEILKLLAVHKNSLKYVEGKLASHRSDNYFQVEYVCGADMFMEKSLFDAINGFDPRFFMYYEESDLQRRLTKLGKSNYILNNIHILHYGGGSEKKELSVRKRTIVSESCLTYMRKHQKKFNYIIFKGLFILLEIFKMIVRGKYHEHHGYITTLIRV